MIQAEERLVYCFHLLQRRGFQSVLMGLMGPFDAPQRRPRVSACGKEGTEEAPAL